MWAWGGVCVWGGRGGGGRRKKMREERRGSEGKGWAGGRRYVDV